MATALTYAAFAFAICTLLHLLALKLFPRCGLLDRPKLYDLQRPSLPYPTGILSVLTFVVFFAIARETPSFQDKGLLVCIMLLAATTLIDDFRNLPSPVRLLIQIGIGFLLLATGTRIYTITNPIGGIIKLDSLLVSNQFSLFNVQFSIPGGPLPLWSGIFTIVWILLTTNAFNWFDGIPGQVSILSAIGGITIGLLAVSGRVNQPDIAVIAFTLAGIALGSALFDFPPNRVVMGDTGAMFFGLMLGTLTIYAGGKVATAFLVLGVPLIDAAFVILRRLRKHRSPFRRDLDHLHHRLLRKGWTERQVIALTVALGSAFGIAALFLNSFGKFVAIILLALAMLGLTRHSRRDSGRSPSAARPR